MSLPNGTEPLSNREMIAAMAMAGWLSGRSLEARTDVDPAEVARRTVRFADALISELAKEKAQ